MRDNDQSDSVSGNGSWLASRGASLLSGVPAAEPSANDNAGWQRRRPLYAGHFGLKESPFDLTPNPRFLFLSPRQREALSNLRYGMTTCRGFTLLTGEAGTGKTTLLRAALGELGDTPHSYVLVSNPTLARGEFYEYLASEFGLSEEARTSKTRFLAELQSDVEGRYSAGGLSGLIVDEAQSLPEELLEEIRLLGNIETTTSKLLNIVLSGQPELAVRLNDSSLRQLKQRIALRCEVGALTLEETAAYISGRLRIAGGNPQDVFTRQAVIGIHEASAGIPRVINVLCDNALIGGFAARAKPITVDLVREVCRDFAIEEPTQSEAPKDVGLVPAVASKPRPHQATPARASSEKIAPVGARENRTVVSATPTPRKRRFIFFGFVLFVLATGQGTVQAATNPASGVSTAVGECAYGETP